MKNILYFTKSDLNQTLAVFGEKPYRTKQIWQWIYRFGCRDFSFMSNISKSSQQILAQNFSIKIPEITQKIVSKDGTIKFLVKFIDNREVEAVYIPEKTRATLCISSQVGCTLACKFCHTGTQTLVRNLEFHEIIAQILIAKNIVNDWSSTKKITNIVFMGMGEPFFNYDNVKKAIDILCDEDGLAFSKRRITISTSGLVPEIIKSASDIKTNLAISLHATNDELRSEIMAINKKYPLSQLFSACKEYNQKNPNDKITFEYVMLKNINDSVENARELASLIKKYNVNAKVNLIPFNKWEGCEYESSSGNATKRFSDILQNNKIITTVRKTRGEDAMAACGQLKSLSKRIPKRI